LFRAGRDEVYDLLGIELCKNGKRLPLQEQPFQVLAALLERPGSQPVNFRRQPGMLPCRRLAV